MNDLISVIVPIYNVEAYLDECIESICDQTYENTEIILIDDGSTDNSGKIADNWAKKDARCTVYHKKNEGLSAARNDGIKAAKGTYLIFVDSDDLIEKNMIERLYQEAIEEKVDIVCCGVKSRTVDRDVVRIYQLDSKILNFEEYFTVMYSNEYHKNMGLPFTVAWNKIYKASLFEKIRYPVGRLHEDYAIIHQLIYLAKKIKWINESLYIYRERPGSIMQSTFSEKKIDEFYAALDRLYFMEHKINNDTLMNVMIAECLNIGRRYWCNIKKAESWSDDKEREVYQEIKKTYRKYVKNNTFSIVYKMMWFVFMDMPSVYYGIWRLMSRLRKIK